MSFGLYLFCNEWTPVANSTGCNEFTITNLRDLNEDVDRLDVLCTIHNTTRVLAFSNSEHWNDAWTEAMSIGHRHCDWCGEWFLHRDFLDHLQTTERCARDFVRDWYEGSASHEPFGDMDAFLLMQQWGFTPPGWLDEMAMAEGWIPNMDDEDEDEDGGLNFVFEPVSTPNGPPSYVQLW